MGSWKLEFGQLKSKFFHKLDKNEAIFRIFIDLLLVKTGYFAVFDEI